MAANTSCWQSWLAANECSACGVGGSKVFHVNALYPEDFKESNAYETLQRKRRRPAHDLNSRPGDLCHGGFHDVPGTVGNVIERQLPLDDPGPLWSGSGPPCGGELSHKPCNRLSRHRHIGPNYRVQHQREPGERGRQPCRSFFYQWGDLQLSCCRREDWLLHRFHWHFDSGSQLRELHGIRAVAGHEADHPVRERTKSHVSTLEAHLARRYSRIA